MIGLDLSDRSIKIIEVSDGDRKKLLTACWSPVQPNIIRRGIIQDGAAATLAIQRALTKCRPVPVNGRAAVVSIPESQSFVRVLDLPQMKTGEMDEAVQWAIRQHIPFDLDRVYLDWQPLRAVSAAANRQQVLVGAAQREVVDPLLEILDVLGLQVIALELEAQAIVRSLLPEDSADVRGVLIVDLGATATNIVIFDRGNMQFTTSIQRGGDDLTQALAQQLQLQPSVAAEKKALVGVQQSSSDPQVAATLRPVAFELVRQIDTVVKEVAVQLNLAEGLRAILLAGGAANLPGIASIFADVFPGVPVQFGNPLINLTFRQEELSLPITAADAVHFTTAIGLALRPIDYLRTS